MSKENKFNIQIKWERMGFDNVFIITGGDSHIGANAITYWSENELFTIVNELPGHKEGDLAKYCAEFAANSLNSTCSVLMGIHVDSATKKK